VIKYATDTAITLNVQQVLIDKILAQHQKPSLTKKQKKAGKTLGNQIFCS